MRTNIGCQVEVTFTGKFEDGCVGASPSGPKHFDHVPVYTYQVVDGDPFLDDPICRLSFLRDGEGNNRFTSLNHMQLVWLQSQGVDIEGMLSRAEAAFTLAE